MQLNTEKQQSACLLAHNLVNKLSGIIGFCDLLIEKAEQQDTERSTRLALIHNLAAAAAKELTDHECQIILTRRNATAGPSNVSALMR